MKRSILKTFLVTVPVFAFAARPIFADETNTVAEPSVTVTPMAQYVTVRGDAAKFREDWGIKDGWTGGIEDATYSQKLGKDWQLNLEGRAIFDNEDYRLRLEIVNPNVGFVRVGFTEFRTYYDDNGGFFRSFTPSSFQLGRDLFVRNGDVFFETGLTLPNLPRLTLGYERQYRDGEKSTLEWGAVTQGATTRNIFPSFKQPTETTDIIKLGVEHDIASVHVADQFRFEHFHQDTTRMDTSVNLNTSSSKTVAVHEDYRHDAFFNTFRMDQHVNNKVFWSMGYLFTTLNGGGNLALDTMPFSSPFDRDWRAQAIAVDLDSHVVNLNTMFGPFAGLSLYAGLQAERTTGNGFTDALLTEIAGSGATNSPAVLIRSSTDKDSLEENFGLRYTKIPFTTLYAEGKWTEQQIDLGERETGGPATAFTRLTDTDIFRQDYTVGFNTAPIPRVTLAGRYRHSIYQNDYEHEVDTGVSALGYPAFITGQDFIEDEIMTKLTLRPCRYFNVAFKYQKLATDIKTATESVPFLAPGRGLKSGNFDANIYSVSATLTPITRLYLTGMFSLQDTRAIAFANGNPAVIPYHGNVYTVMGTAGYALDNKTDMNVEYTYSRTDNTAVNASAGLPLGLSDQRTGLLVGLTRRVSSNVMARVRYGFYDYNDRSGGGIDNYTAHLASASCTVRF
ncbi:MAG: hypothetical protein ABSA97_02805 [Verrucomicrobiia bacterium]